MPNPNKAKGDRAERAVRDYLRDNGFPNCERTRAGYTRDAGDLHPCRGVIVQVKDRAAYAWPEWLRQLAEQKAEAEADHALLVLKRRGLGDPGEWLAVMPLDAMTTLLKAAGYGTISDTAEIWPEHGDTTRESAQSNATRDILVDAVDPHGTQPTPAQESRHSPPLQPKETPVPFVNPRTGLPADLAPVPTVAAKLQCSPRTVHYMLQREKLTRFKIGGMLRVDLNELDTLVTVEGGEVA